jgi:hypothetical protein
MPMSLFQIDITEIVIGCQDNKIEEMSIFYG